MPIKEPEAVKNIADVIVLGGIPLGAVIEFLPEFAALVSIVYGLIRIYLTLEARFKKRDNDEGT